MADAFVGDLLALDRDVAQGAPRLARWRAALRTDPEAHAGEDPLSRFRQVAGRSAWDALGGLPAGGADARLIAGLRRWIYFLLQARLSRAGEVAWARAAAAPCGLIEGEDPRRVSWREAWRDVVVVKTPGEAQQRMEAAAAGGPSLAGIATRIADRRVEVARRLGLSHPWEPAVGLTRREVRTTAARFLDATDDLSRSLRAERARLPGAAAALHRAVAREAGHGWPGHLTPRWLHETFGSGTEGLKLDLPTLPATLGAASFARALSMFGFALRVAAAPHAMPFSIANEPAFVGAHRLAFVFGSLACDHEFYGRVLGLGRRTSLAQARMLTDTALLEARLHAARILLGDEEALAPCGLFEEIGTRLFGSPLDPKLRGAWPRAREDEPARWVAILEASALRESLRQDFDVDWFRNPRAWAHLRARGAVAAREPVDPSAVGGGADALAHAFERALG